MKNLLKLWDSFLNSFWKILVSVRLAVVLLLTLIFFSILGSVIAQQGTTQVPIEELYSYTTLKVLAAFGLTDLFHSPLFIGLLLLLALNLIACSIERLPKVWKEAFREEPPFVEMAPLLNINDNDLTRRKIAIHEFKDTDSLSQARFFQVLSQRFSRYTILKDDGAVSQVFIQKSKYSRLGVYVTHLSLLLIMGGGVVGALFGFEGSMSIEESTRQSWIQHTKGSQGGMKTFVENNLPVPGFLNLGFEVECERFDLETYDGERPKAFRSSLKFYENDVLTKSVEIAVNQPTVYRGITFYQASYQELGPGSVTLKLYRVRRDKQAAVAARKNGRSIANQTAVPSLFPKNQKMPPIESVERVEKVRLGHTYRVDGNASFKILQVEKNMMGLGPGMQVQLFPHRNSKKPEEFWVFQELPGFDFAHRQDTGLHFVLEEIHPKYATGLSVAKDPGVWIVWIGSLILIGALFLALYTCHGRYWIQFQKNKNILLVGSSNKFFLFEPRFKKIMTQLSEDFKK